MTVEPGNRRADATEDNLVGDKHIHLVHIETLVSGTMQTGEHLVKTVGDGLCLTLIYIGGKTNAQNGNYRTCGCHLHIKVNGIVFAVGSDKTAEAATPTKESCQCGIDTHTNGNHTKHDERQCHGQRSLMWSVVSMKLFVLCAPEDTIIQTEHVEGGHRSNTCHDPSHHRTVGKAGSDDFIL